VVPSPETQTASRIGGPTIGGYRNSSGMGARSPWGGSLLIMKPTREIAKFGARISDRRAHSLALAQTKRTLFYAPTWLR
jgi:hypothetical protein